MNIETIPNLRRIVNASDAMKSPLIDLAIGIDFCAPAAVDAIAGRLDPDAPHNCPLLAELRAARVGLEGLCAAVEVLEQAIVRRRHDIYVKALASRE